MFFHYDFQNFFFNVPSCFILVEVCWILSRNDFYWDGTVQYGNEVRNDERFQEQFQKKESPEKGFISFLSWGFSCFGSLDVAVIQQYGQHDGCCIL